MVYYYHFYYKSYSVTSEVTLWGMCSLFLSLWNRNCKIVKNGIEANTYRNLYVFIKYGLLQSLLSSHRSGDLHNDFYCLFFIVLFAKYLPYFPLAISCM